MDFVLGQRWVSQTESDLGLGIVIEIEGRHVTVQFPASEEERVYALNNCPLARVIYQVGETLHDQDHQPLEVQSVQDLDGLKCYVVKDQAGAESLLPETQISALVHLTSPSQRLLSGQFDKAFEYQLRVATLEQQHQLEVADARGLLGPRTSLLSHQIYIAHEVASRYAPRVLLADEVGLGKTIEAGLILHRQLHTGLANRVLIVVPDPLLHQWLVEMLRKFGLKFSLFDQARYDALIESGEANPFESEQLVLCGMNLFVDQDELVDQAIDAGWDLLVVDEAHHLAWSPESTSPQYDVVQALSLACAGLLLLTATPEQLGMVSHFARLRLLDASRFSDLEQFLEEQDHYTSLNAIVAKLAAGEPFSTEQQAHLDALPGVDSRDTTPAHASNDALITQLLDQHGTGRVLFRNTRSAISGFPERQLHSYALTLPDAALSNSTTSDTDNTPASDGYLLDTPQPEKGLQDAGLDWLTVDPRVAWLEGFLRDHRSDKILLICANAQTAIDLEHHLHLTVGVRSSAFYESLSIIERDRAAAYFADHEAGAQILICSEIGSEGRNFQFAHHLVLFDLPTNPDLLEQRIGRLDRIGQTTDIHIHVPYLTGTAQEVLFSWYQQGLNAFTESFAAGSAVLERFGDALAQAMAAPQAQDQLAALINDSAKVCAELRAELEHGRDRLLELNSHKPETANTIIDQINEIEVDEALSNYVNLACDTFGVEPEPHSENSLVLKPTEHMQTHAFPEIGDDGLTVTYDRNTALAREDMTFLTWESPVISDVMELIMGF